jgi:hypothetical protein
MFPYTATTSNSLHLFVLTQIFIQYHFSSVWKTSLIFLCEFFSFCLSEKKLYFAFSFLKDIFTGYKTLDLSWFFSFLYFKDMASMSSWFYCFLWDICNSDCCPFVFNVSFFFSVIISEFSHYHWVSKLILIGLGSHFLHVSYAWVLLSLLNQYMYSFQFIWKTSVYFQIFLNLV